MWNVYLRRGGLLSTKPNCRNRPKAVETFDLSTIRSLLSGGAGRILLKSASGTTFGGLNPRSDPHAEASHVANYPPNGHGATGCLQIFELRPSCSPRTMLKTFCLEQYNAQATG